MESRLDQGLRSRYATYNREKSRGLATPAIAHVNIIANTVVAYKVTTEFKLFVAETNIALTGTIRRGCHGSRRRSCHGNQRRHRKSNRRLAQLRRSLHLLAWCACRRFPTNN